MKDDTAITDDDITNSNLILWGDPSSNAVLAEDRRPAPAAMGRARSSSSPARPTTPRTPRPCSSSRTRSTPPKYIVLNSGPTFREEALLNNSQQIPKLPDWAIIDLNTPPDGKWPGEVVNAGFFDEQWKAPAK